MGGGRLTGSAAARTYFFAFAAGSEDVLLEHFVSHYSALGINFATNSRLVLHLTGAAEVAAREQASVAYLRRKSIPFRSSPRYTSKIKALLANGYLRTLPDEALLMYPDLDEFFALPCRVGDLLARSERKFLLTAKFRERLPRHWACDPFPRLQPASERPIHAQYPVACPIIASGARRGVFGTALSLGYQKQVLFSVRDERGRRVQYQSSHSCTCIDDAAPDEKHECELQEYGAPDIAHFRFTHEAIELLWNKLSGYSAAYIREKEGTRKEKDDASDAPPEGAAGFSLLNRFASGGKGKMKIAMREYYAEVTLP